MPSSTLEVKLSDPPLTIGELDEQIVKAEAAREAIEHALACPHEDIRQCPNFGRLLAARLSGRPLHEAHSH